MYDDVNNMVAFGMVLMKIVIYRKADVGNGPGRIDTIKSYVFDCVERKIRYADMWIFNNAGLVVKIKGGIQDVGINSETQCQEKE